MTYKNKKLRLPPSTGTKHAVFRTMLVRGRNGKLVSYDELSRDIEHEYGDPNSSAYGNIRNTVVRIEHDILIPLGFTLRRYKSSRRHSSLNERGIFIKREKE